MSKQFSGNPSPAEQSLRFLKYPSKKAIIKKELKLNNENIFLLVNEHEYEYFGNQGIFIGRQYLMIFIAIKKHHQYLINYIEYTNLGRIENGRDLLSN